MTSVWLRPEPDRARRQPQLGRELIVDAAVALLDAGGVGGLTMRKLAERLGVTSTALYWHVSTKGDVLDLATDRIFGEVVVRESADWRADVHTLAVAWRHAMLRHPWVPPLVGRPMLGPNVLSRTEFLQTALMRGGLTGTELTVVTRLVANYVIGAALTASTWQAAEAGDRAAARRHVTEAYPALRASGHPGEARDDEELFAAGLTRILTA